MLFLEPGHNESNNFNFMRIIGAGRCYLDMSTVLKQVFLIFTSLAVLAILCPDALRTLKNSFAMVYT
jgi:hypothetical protein